MAALRNNKDNEMNHAENYSFPNSKQVMLSIVNSDLCQAAPSPSLPWVFGQSRGKSVGAQEENDGNWAGIAPKHWHCCHSHIRITTNSCFSDILVPSIKSHQINCISMAKSQANNTEK